MVKVICDRCGAEITGKTGEICIKMHEKPDFDSPFSWIAGEKGDEDYCERCGEEIARFIRNAPQERTEPQEAETIGAEKKKATRRRIDYGKIMALRNAGWDNGKIAEEMHMTKASVSQAISKCRNQGGKRNETESE